MGVTGNTGAKGQKGEKGQKGLKGVEGNFGGQTVNYNFSKTQMIVILHLAYLNLIMPIYHQLHNYLLMMKIKTQQTYNHI